MSAAPTRKPIGGKSPCNMLATLPAHHSSSPPEIDVNVKGEEVYQYKGEIAKLIPHDVTKVEVHPSVQKILENAFNNCRRLKSLVLCNHLKEIGNSAFSYCKSLKKSS